MPTKKSDERVNIQGPSGDVIEITRGEFETSHYAEQGYEIAGPVATDDPDAPKTIPIDGAK